MLGGSYRAQLQRRVAGGRAEDICGPRRGEKRKAEEDLEALRAAAEQAGPDAAWSAMADVSQCLQERARFEALVSLHLEQGVSLSRGCSSALANSENQSLDMDDTQLSSVDEYYNDSNELWQEIDDTGQLPDWKPAPTVPVADPQDAVEATALLSMFRPARGTVEDLKKLLLARADPNITLCGDVHPLIKVMTFAHQDRAAPMRDLLLQAGAVESNDAKEQWELRCRADANEQAWLRNFHRDPR